MSWSQSTYLATETLPFAYDRAKAKRVRTHLRNVSAWIEAVAFELETDLDL